MTVGPGTRLGPYEIVAPLGAGGMGEVYRARDTRLGRDVAIKVLPAAFAADPDRLRRFEQEARATAALDHPNILSIYDVGTHEGAPYIVEQLLEGESLRQRLDGGALPVNKAIETAVAISNGLAAAHAKSIVHRDLKPENVFITRDGTVKILDFGLAKLAAPPEGTDLSALPTASAPHTILGTVGYMAPEQVRGQPADHRADIFALGCVLYEMLSGQRAFSGATNADTLSAILSSDPRPLSRGGWERAVSPLLEGIVARCLEKRPGDRFSSAHDLALALAAASWPQQAPPGAVPVAVRPRRGLSLALAAAAALVLAAVGVTVVRSLLRKAPPSPLPGEAIRVAVLPFENLGAAGDAAFVDGMADEVRGALSGLRGLAVIARESSETYRKTTKPARQIAGELGVRHLLTATVRWQKTPTERRIRVTPQLVEVGGESAPTTRWQQSFDAPLDDVFRVQSEIATRVAAALDVALGAGERQRLEAPPTTNLAAWEAHLRAMEVSNGMSRFDPATLRRAAEYWEQAVALDPSFALAWSYLSGAWSNLYFAGDRSRATAEQAREAAERAVQLAPHDAGSRAAMGVYYHIVKGDIPRALEEYHLGLASNPRDTTLLNNSSDAETRVGGWEQALERAELAVSLDSRSVNAARRLGSVLLRMHRYPEALAAYDRALALDPANLTVITNRAQVLLGQGDLAAARALVAAASRTVGATRLAAHVAVYSDLYWVLDEEQQRLLLRLTPSAFDENRALWAIVMAQVHDLHSAREECRRYAEEAARGFSAQLQEAPDDAQLHVFHGLALAYLGRRDEAIAEGERAVTLLPLARDSWNGAYVQHQLARIHLVLGNHEKALDLLTPLLEAPYVLSPAWLAIDPNFAPLRGNPRFEALVKKEVGPL